MIIFDLDGTLADCEHRRHFVDPSKNKDYSRLGSHKRAVYRNNETNERFKPEWKAFYEACDKDDPIRPAWFMFNRGAQWAEVEIWSGRCESVREKTIDWLMNRCPLKPTYWNKESWNCILKMRPIGDSTPDDVLKEKWIADRMSDLGHQLNPRIDFVFDSDPRSVEMWKKNGIFVFNCDQNDGEF